MNQELNNLFNPKSVALIGASTKTYSIGNVIIKNLLRYNYQGEIYPINVKGEDIHGVKAYKSIFDVPGKVDLAHIVIPPPFVPQEVENCGQMGVKAIIINTAGFKEMGIEGKKLEDDFLERAKKYNIRIFGPNCQGIINSDPEYKAYCNFTFTYFKPGSISIVAQSGGVGAVIMQAFHDMGIGMRLYASNGNGSDISIPEIMRYYGNDEKTKVIVLYIESIADIKEFMETASEVAAKKPVLAISAGRTEKGAEASKSHTGGLAGGMTMELIFKKAGIISFTKLDELCYASIAFATQPIPKGKNVGMITNTGGPAIIATDELVSRGLSIPKLTENAKSILKTTMFPAASINNPLDVVATAGAAQFKSAFEVMMNEPQIDSVYLTFVTPPFVDCESVAKELAEINNKQIKPMVCNYITDKQGWIETTNILQDSGIPCYDFPETAGQALASLVKYHEITSREKGSIVSFDDVDKLTVANILRNVKSQNRENLSAKEVYEILSAYQIPVADWMIAENLEEALAAADKIGYPVVIKADSEQVIHKSDVGGVAVNLTNSEEVENAVKEMKGKIGQNDLKFFVQKFLSGGKELIIGANKEEGLGHLIMFGLGGIFVEIFKDVIFNISPITDVESYEMVENIKASKILGNYRGKPGIDKQIISVILQRISLLVTDFPEIKELDLNPVFAFENSAYVVDARIII
ncbi:MAG: CoA-binding protein [Ignavibacteria bacterium GWF2_33_9]|nr:MAG: CoA-binding protein [Ignavibacteria bacterium GWF2_33_9]